MSEKNDKLADAFCRLIGMAGRTVRHRLDHNLSRAGYDLSAMHMLLLGFLCEHEGVNQQTLTEHMFRDKTATTRWIDFLESKDLVVRVPDKTDRRQKMVFMTMRGKELVKELLQIVWLTEKEALQDIDPQQIDICKEVLKQVRRNLAK